MRFRSPDCTIAARRGNAALILVNLIVLLLIVGLGAGYYFFQVRPAQAAVRHTTGLEMEKKGHLTSAELAYREAIRLDPSNPHYHQSLELLLSGKGNLDSDILAMPKPEARSASAALWPKEERVSSTPSLSESGPLVNTAPAPPAEPAVLRKNVELDIVAPDGAELEIRAANADLYVPGEIVQPWIASTGRYQRDLPPGEYELAIRLPETTPGVSAFSVKEGAGVLQSVKFEFGLLRIDSTPKGAAIYEAKSGDVVGETPFAALRPPGDVVYTLKAEGYESSTLDGAVATRGVLHFDHKLARVAPASPPAKAAEKPVETAPKSKGAASAIVAAEPKPEKKPEPAVAEPAVAEAAVAEAIAQAPVFGRPFVGAEGLEFVFGEKSNRGDPFWMTKATPLKGWGEAAALDYCAKLTAAEERAGRVPAGYAYLPSILGDGRIALCRKYYEGDPPPVTAPVVVEERPVVTPLAAGQDARPTIKAVVVEPAPPAPAPSPAVVAPAPEASATVSGIAVGESFVNGDRIWMEYRKEDVHGNPFWRSVDSTARGMSLERAKEYCVELTERERAAGRVPSGYVYSVAAEGDGRIVLWRNVLPARVTSAER